MSASSPPRVKIQGSFSYVDAKLAPAASDSDEKWVETEMWQEALAPEDPFCLMVCDLSAVSAESQLTRL